MKVLHIIPTLCVGGAERFVASLLIHLADSETEPALCCLYAACGTFLETQVRKSGIRVWYLGKHRGPDVRMAGRIAGVLHEFKPDVVHTHLNALRYSLWPTVLSKIPVRVHTMHSVAQYETDALGKILRYAAFRLLGVFPISISPSVAHTVRALYGVPRTRVIYNGIDVEAYRVQPTARHKTRHQLGIPFDAPVLLHIGRFAPEKNHRFLMRVFTEVKRHSPNARLLLVGDGRLRSQIQEEVSSSVVANDVVFLGIRVDIPELLAASDLLLLPSKWEGTPTVLMEAMAAGVPVVATNVGGIPNVVENGLTGFTIALDDFNGMVSVVLRLLGDDRLRFEMGQNARRVAERRFSIATAASEHKRLYAELLDSRSHSVAAFGRNTGFFT